MVTTVILSMLCVHLLCFSVMFLLISTRLNGKKMGMEVFALGNLLLGLAYILQLLGGPANWGMMSIVNHTMTLCAPVAYVLGALRFFDRPTAVWRPLLMLAVLYTALQVTVQFTLGSEARHALLAASCTLLFLGMAVGVLYARQNVARDLRVEMVVFAILIGGICALNAVKFVMILQGGLAALDMGSGFQKVFYLYMSFLGTVLPPCAVWLVLRRLTDELRTMAAHDPLTQLLNRRGLVEGLDAHFRSRNAGPAYLLIVDIDHFKQINDSHGHQVGDLVLCHVAQVLKATARKGDLACRLGGEEFVLVGLNTDRTGALQLAERARAAIEQSEVPGTTPNQPIRCTATIGVSEAFTSAQALDEYMQQADSALYRGKTSGRNRVESALA
ncbi:GGDEF domain-containing protein [Pseudomonas nicosulfuronedens]|uniref:diguanylate cyclase n=1 Tax=Pseudomonas nicosulfuronedens TaxID=2571105 RepID=A0A5R9QU66_9PSED|nr:GGDEF domain-containing protein [Pseudomonas nicosulfuronedens]MDH1010076.1 GGDEF domain-containing protein [Pseudomonas nicosulfuronedens]MDH1980092.1 GGDEF domain-containing protein [Pseudomonas nicosulfuronedens]MDH2025311.1 GGDEF domain-containing protein [Pseudomonas nicosulfuronedens]TLX73596.1 GGDEF domain-containing protein [Pseudomonas nicosulfuronedens]